MGKFLIIVVLIVGTPSHVPWTLPGMTAEVYPDEISSFVQELLFPNANLPTNLSEVITGYTEQSFTNLPATSSKLDAQTEGAVLFADRTRDDGSRKF